MTMDTGRAHSSVISKIRLVSQIWGHYKGSRRCMSAVLCVSLARKIIDIILTINPDPGGNSHREYDLEFRRLIPFLRLPRLKSLYTLTALVFWHQAKSPVDDQAFKHISNVKNLTYDECMLTPFDVSNSLSMFRSLETFRWTTAQSCFGTSDHFVGFQSGFGKSLFAHKDTLKDLYFDNRHPRTVNNPSRFEGGPDSIMVGSFNSYSKLKKLAIDDDSLLGHQDWKPLEGPLVDILPPNLEDLTLFVKVIQDHDNSEATELILDNHYFYPVFLTMLRSAGEKLPKLEKIRIELTRDTSNLWRIPNPVDIMISENLFAEARSICCQHGISLDVGIAVEWDEYNVRNVGSTNIPYFLEQIQGRNPGRDF